MGKIYGLFGSITGKVADVVMAVRNGVQIVRKYQPSVLNPNTAGQIENRAKLKLLSQVSAVFAPYIAIPRRGAVTSRNLFVKKNYPVATFTNNQADINLTAVKLTDGVVGLPEPVVSYASGNISVSLSANASTLFESVVYTAFRRDANSSLRVVGATIIDTPGDNGQFAGTIPSSADSGIVVYAYGVRVNSDTSRVSYANLLARADVTPADIVAFLNTTRASDPTNVTISETRAVMLTNQA